MRARSLVLVALLSGCAPGIYVDGRVFESRDAQIEGEVEEQGRLEGAHITLLGAFGEAVVQPASTTARPIISETLSAGRFALRSPRSQVIYLTVDNTPNNPLDPLVSFSGVAGDTAMEVPVLNPNGTAPTLYNFSADELAAVEEKFAGCPNVGTGGVIVGTIEFFQFEQIGGPEPIPDPDERTWQQKVKDAVQADPPYELIFDDGFLSPPLRSGRVTLDPLTEGASVPVTCYLDGTTVIFDEPCDETTLADGELCPDPVASAGTTREYAAFGVDVGLYTLSVEFEVQEADVFSQAFYEVWMPEGPNRGVVPRFPLWVEFPTDI